jgi:hypothetical protein
MRKQAAVAPVSRLRTRAALHISHGKVAMKILWQDARYGLRMLPSYHDPERLITFHTTESVLDLNDIRAWNQSFAEIGGNTIQPLDC